MIDKRFQQIVALAVSNFTKVNKTRLVKTLFIADRIYTERNRKALIDIDWFEEGYGPIINNFSDLLEEMELNPSNKLIIERNVGMVLHGFLLEEETELSDAEKEAIKYAVEMYGILPIDKLLAEVERRSGRTIFAFRTASEIVDFMQKYGHIYEAVDELPQILYERYKNAFLSYPKSYLTLFVMYCQQMVEEGKIKALQKTVAEFLQVLETTENFVKKNRNKRLPKEIKKKFALLADEMAKELGLNRRSSL